MPIEAPRRPHPHHAQAEIHPARPDDHHRHHRRPAITATASRWRSPSPNCSTRKPRRLQADGVDMIQFDEPAFNVYMDEVSDWGIKALERAAEGLTCATAVHICYGYGIKANTDWKETLGERVAAIRGDLSGDRQEPDPAGRDRMPQFEGAAGTARRCSTARSCRPASSTSPATRSRPPRTSSRSIDAVIEIRAEEQHRRDHQLRHGADAARYRGSQADGARRGREAGEAEVGLTLPQFDRRHGRTCEARPADPAGLRQAVREAGQDGCGRRRGDQRGGDPQDDALRADQIG